MQTDICLTCAATLRTRGRRFALCLALAFVAGVVLGVLLRL